jgi:drug/metabolite transporter (DMT)-like permease
LNVGVLWALVAAVGFALLQASNRKANQHLDAYRTAFGLLVAVEVVLLARSVILGRVGLLFTAPASAVLIFGVTTLFHFVGGWTLLALSQQKVGVARTGALVSAAPIIGTLVAAIGLGEPLTTTIVAGVLLAVAGVALISLSGAGTDGEWRRPWLGLTVALIWGSTPLLIRLGLEQFDHPVEGLTIGLATSVVVYAILLTLSGGWKGAIPGTALHWVAFGGLCGAVAVSAQWLSFDLTTIAVAITVQQLSVLFVIALVPLMFRQPFERMNLRFFAGAAMVVAGACLVVLL